MLDENLIRRAENGSMDEFNKEYYETDKVVKVSIPIEAHLTIEYNCDNLEVAMIDSIILNENLGILGVTGGYVEYGDVDYQGIEAKFI